MTEADLAREARLIVSRNLTKNVAGAKATFDSKKGHLYLVYYLFDAPTESDVEELELSVGELIAAFPEIRTATSGFDSHREMNAEDRIRLREP